MKKIQILFFVIKARYFVDACKIFQGDMSHSVKWYPSILQSVLRIKVSLFRRL